MIKYEWLGAPSEKPKLGQSNREGSVPAQSRPSIQMGDEGSPSGVSAIERGEEEMER